MNARANTCVQFFRQRKENNELGYTRRITDQRYVESVSHLIWSSVRSAQYSLLRSASLSPLHRCACITHAVNSTEQTILPSRSLLRLILFPLSCPLHLYTSPPLLCFSLSLLILLFHLHSATCFARVLSLSLSLSLLHMCTHAFPSLHLAHPWTRTHGGNISTVLTCQRPATLVFIERNC